jgi:hypothetical protein
MKYDIKNLSLREFTDIVNDEQKTLPSSAFSNTVEEYDFEQPFVRKIKEFNRYGVNFSVREQETDRWAEHERYIKRDENDEHLRDEKGGLVHHDAESIKDIFSEEERFVYEHSVYDEDRDKMAARTQDEWGCLLIRTASEYEGFGLGEELLFEHRKVRPFRHTGGYSPQGINCEQKAFRRLVLDNKEKGYYNTLPEERRKKILDSVSKIKTFKERYDNVDGKEKDLYNYSNKEDYLYHVDERFVLIYNRKLYDLLSDKDVDIYSDRSQMLIRDGIVGYMDLLGNSDSLRIFKSFSKDKETLETMLGVLSEINGSSDFEIYKRDMKDFSQLTSVELKEGRDFCHLTYTGDVNNEFKIKHAVSQKLKKMLDPFEEKWSVIHEAADGFAKESMEKNDNVFEEKIKKKSLPSNKKMKP